MSFGTWVTFNFDRRPDGNGNEYERNEGQAHVCGDLRNCVIDFMEVRQEQLDSNEYQNNGQP